MKFPLLYIERKIESKQNWKYKNWKTKPNDGSNSNRGIKTTKHIYGMVIIRDDSSS